MNDELWEMFKADQDERRTLTRDQDAYLRLRENDQQRRMRAQAILDEGGDLVAEDYYHAALLFQHGDAPDEVWLAHTLALKAVDLGSQPARWLSAASLDRWLMYSGKPQKYGTQYVWDGTRDRLWDVDQSTTDADRAELNVPPLAEQIEKAVVASQNRPPAPIGDGAPQWLTDALKRWGV
jgi:hypothetical protein